MKCIAIHAHMAALETSDHGERFVNGKMANVVKVNVGTTKKKKPQQCSVTLFDQITYIGPFN